MCRVNVNIIPRKILKYYGRLYLRKMRKGSRILSGLRLREATAGPRIAVINAVGAINSGPSSNGGIQGRSLGSDSLVALIRQAEKDPGIIGAKIYTSLKQIMHDNRCCSNRSCSSCGFARRVSARIRCDVASAASPEQGEARGGLHGRRGCQRRLLLEHGLRPDHRGGAHHHRQHCESCKKLLLLLKRNIDAFLD